MKQKIILIFIFILIISIFTACNYYDMPDYDAEAERSMFVIVEQAPNWLVVYHKTTRVMYAVSDGSYTYGNFTLLVDADGSPLLWDGKNEE